MIPRPPIKYKETTCVFCNVLPRKFVVNCEGCSEYMNICESCFNTMKNEGKILNISSINSWISDARKYVIRCEACDRDKKIDICLSNVKNAEEKR